MVTDMKLDTTLTIEEISLEPIVVTPLLLRVAQMGAKLDVHECFISLLGVADVQIERLPYSIKLSIYWNESKDAGVELYIIDTGDSITRQQGIYNALQKYLEPSLKGDN